MEEERPWRNSSASGGSGGGPPSFVHPNKVQEDGGVASPGGEVFLDPYEGDEHGGMQVGLELIPILTYLQVSLPAHIKVQAWFID